MWLWNTIVIDLHEHGFQTPSLKNSVVSFQGRANPDEQKRDRDERASVKSDNVIGLIELRNHATIHIAGNSVDSI